MNSISSEEFEQLVANAIDGLPEPLASRMSNVAISVQDLPGDDEAGDSQLLGLYEGIPLTERDGNYSGVLPDRITLFKRNLELAADGPRDLEKLVRETIIHEIAHHFGIDDDRLEELGWD